MARSGLDQPLRHPRRPPAAWAGVLAALAAACAATLGAAPTRAAPAEPEAPPAGSAAAEVVTPEPTRGRAPRFRPTGVLELGLGLLALPGAPVCVDRIESGCEIGDFTPLVELGQMFRLVPAWGIGASLGIGFATTAEAPRSDPSGFEREHERRYFTLDALGRWYAHDGETLDAWVGASVGLVVVSDAFAAPTTSSERALVGPRASSLRTEGLGLSGAVGATWALGGRWSAGAALRPGLWFLPGRPARTRVGDEASLTGRIDVLSLGLALSYAAPL